MDVLTFQIYIWFYLINLRLESHKTYESIVFDDVSTLLNDPSTNGRIFINNLVISGFDTITLTTAVGNHINVTEIDADTQVFKVCIKIPIRRIDVNMDYVVDMAINQTIPLYGEGKFEFSVTDVIMDFCTLTNITEGNAYDMNLLMAYRYQPISLTGMYKNRHANKMILDYLNMANSALAMWVNYEPANASCLLSPVFQYVLNADFGYPRNSFTYDPDCLQGSTLDYLQQLLKEMKVDATDIFGTNNNPVKSLLEMYLKK